MVTLALHSIQMILYIKFNYLKVVEYVNNSLTKDFPSGNSGVDINDMNVTYDAANRIITIKSTGGGTGNCRHD